MNKMILGVGVVLIFIAIILGAMQHFYFNPNNQSLYGGDENKYYFYGLVAIIGLIGIILVAWSYMRKTSAPTSAPTSASTSAPTQLSFLSLDGRGAIHFFLDILDDHARGG